MDNIYKETLVSREEIKAKVKELGARITADFKDKPLLAVCILKGGFMFFADLLRELDIDCEVDFMRVSSYGDGTTTSGYIKVIQDIDLNLSGRHTLIVEDLIDTGLTLKRLRELLESRNPESVSICAIFDKPSRRLVDVEVEYKGIEIPDEFVVGYGLDYAGKYRQLPDLRTLNPDKIK